MPSCTGWQRMGLIAALLVAASACGGTSTEGTGAGSPSTGYTGGITEAEARGGTSTEGTGVASSSAGGVTGAEEAGGEVFFPQHRTDTPLVGYNGRIVEDGAGCIRFEISENGAVMDGRKPTVLWPRPWSAERGKAGRVRIFDVEGRAVGRTGDEVFLIGFTLPKENPLEEVQSVDGPTTRELLRRCPGLYYFTNDIEPPRFFRGETTSS